MRKENRYRMHLNKRRQRTINNHKDNRHRHRVLFLQQLNKDEDEYGAECVMQ